MYQSVRAASRHPWALRQVGAWDWVLPSCHGLGARAARRTTETNSVRQGSHRFQSAIGTKKPPLLDQLNISSELAIYGP